MTTIPGEFGDECYVPLPPEKRRRSVSILDVLKGAFVTKAELHTAGGLVDVTAMMTRPVEREPHRYASSADLRPALLKAIGDLSPAHPSLSWQVNGTLLACRRADEGVTVCGRRGELTVAVDPGVPPCPKCCPGG